MWVVSKGSDAVESIASDSGIHNPIPTWLTIALIFSGVSWLVRGQTYTVPKWTFRPWLIMSLSTIALVYIGDHAPIWLTIPFFLGLYFFAVLLDDQNACGQRNFEGGEGLAANSTTS